MQVSILCTVMRALFTSWKVVCISTLFFGVSVLAAFYSSSQCVRKKRTMILNSQNTAGAAVRKAKQVQKESNSNNNHAKNCSSTTSTSSSMRTATNAPFEDLNVMKTEPTQPSSPVKVEKKVESPRKENPPSWVQRRREARKRRDMESIKRAQAKAYTRQRHQPDENTLFEVENAEMPEVDFTAEFYAKIKANQSSKLL